MSGTCMVNFSWLLFATLTIGLNPLTKWHPLKMEFKDIFFCKLTFFDNQWHIKHQGVNTCRGLCQLQVCCRNKKSPQDDFQRNKKWKQANKQTQTHQTRWTCYLRGKLWNFYSWKICLLQVNTCSYVIEKTYCFRLIIIIFCLSNWAISLLSFTWWITHNHLFHFAVIHIVKSSDRLFCSLNQFAKDSFRSWLRDKSML